MGVTRYVIPAQAGIQLNHRMDTGLHRYDGITTLRHPAQREGSSNAATFAGCFASAQHDELRDANKERT